jgi:hypothetical protein
MFNQFIPHAVIDYKAKRKKKDEWINFEENIIDALFSLQYVSTCLYQKFSRVSSSLHTLLKVFR